LEEETLVTHTFALSSAESEIYAASEAGKYGIYIKNICIGVGKLKHIDLRESWIGNMRRRDILSYRRIPGAINKANFFTKIVGEQEFIQGEEDMMPQV